MAHEQITVVWTDRNPVSDALDRAAKAGWEVVRSDLIGDGNHWRFEAVLRRPLKDDSRPC